MSNYLSGDWARHLGSFVGDMLLNRKPVVVALLMFLELLQSVVPVGVSGSEARWLLREMSAYETEGFVLRFGISEEPKHAVPRCLERALLRAEGPLWKVFQGAGWQGGASGLQLMSRICVC